MSKKITEKGLAKETRDAYDLVSEAILEQLSQGVAPWRKPWTAINSGATRASGDEYRGINQFLLSLKAAVSGYGSRLWLTFNQARAWVPKDEKGGVRKGEKSTVVIFWKFLKEKETGTERVIPFLRYYRVFNLDQCEGIVLPKALEAKLDVPLDKPVDPIAEAEAAADSYLARGGPSITWTPGDRACYSPKVDRVTMPVREQFGSSNTLYGTLFHELGHSTGHSSRLDRGLDTDCLPFGSEDYSREELVAELTSAFVMSAMGLDPDIPQNAAYFQGWQRTFEDDKKAIIWAASRATKAANLILNLTNSEEEKGETEDE
jgi:antirestriction protein ArdC